MVSRALKISKSNSFFLFGGRGTGKSTLLKDELFQADEALYVDLLLPSEFDRLVRNPQSLLDQIAGLDGSKSWVVLDEVQKVPQLLDVVHHAIENLKIKFALSGSSARKLKRGSANLLAGRAFVYHLFPLTHRELANNFRLEEALNFGTLPKIFEFQQETDRNEYLRAYTHTYLREEVIAEQVVRALPPFRRFLEIAARMNGMPLNYAAIARDVGVDDKTVKNYYSILEDTLLGFFLEPFHRSIRKTQTEAPRFYFFDPGVKRAIEGSLSSKIIPQSYAWGKAFEHFVIAEAMRLNEYLRKDYRFYFLRTQAGAEVDLIVERPGGTTVFVEIKSTTEVNELSVRKLENLAASVPNVETMIFSSDPVPKTISLTRCVSWELGLCELGFV